MKYTWFDSKDTLQKNLEAIAGITISSIIIGQIPTGELMDMLDNKGNVVKMPVTKKGIEIEVASSLTADQLRKLDIALADKQRDGSNILTKEIDGLKARLEKLEKKVITR